MPKKNSRPPTPPLPNPRTAQSPDAAALLARRMLSVGLFNPLLAMGAPIPKVQPPQRNNKRGRR